MGSKRSTENWKKDDSYIGVMRHKRRRNIMIVIPIIAGVVALGVVAAYVYSAQAPTKQMVIHIHPHLAVTVDGPPVTVQSQIGIDPSLWKNHTLDQYGMQGMAPLHTHDASGTIHVESNAYRDYTLGDFLNIWGQFDTNSKTIKATVDGKPVSDYKDIILSDGEQINLNVGSK